MLNFIRKFFIENVGLKIISLVLAFMLWFYVVSELKKGSEEENQFLNRVFPQQGVAAKKLLIRPIFVGKLKNGYDCNADVSILSDIARKISEISNTQIESSRPYIGSSAFAHKAGMHIDGVLKVSRSFEHIDPTLVGTSADF